MFSIFGVPAGAAETSEQMGTKFKFWYHDEHFGTTLFKEGRPGTGENWSEVLAAELARILGIPHATYEFAEWQARAGVISPSFVPAGGRLIHGNELVSGKVTVANQNAELRYYAQRNHTASRVFQFLKLNEDFFSLPQGLVSFEGVHSALAVFVGYVMFDAWIANQDRHSENWGVVRSVAGISLAPSYDHGSALGRQQTDEQRQVMMSTKDKGASIDAYVRKARSAMYPPAPAGQKPKAYPSVELFEYACKIDAVAGRAWLGKLAMISEEDIRAAIELVPEDLMSAVARQFTARLLKLNLDRLLSVEIT